MSANAIRRTVLILSCIVAGGLIPLSASAQTPQRVTGTTVTITPPAGFTPAKDFAGFADEKTKSSILIAELPPEAWPQLSALFGNLDTVRAGFKQKGIEVATLDKVPTASGEAFLASGTQTAAGTKLGKWVALAQGSRTVMITVQAMPTAKLDDAAIKAMLKTVSLGAPPSEADKLASLPFKVAPSAPFRVLDTMGGTGVAMTVGEKSVDPKGEQPLLIVSSQVSGGSVAGVDQAALAKTLLKQTREMEKAEIDTEKKVSFGGSRDGVLLEGKAGENKRFVQYFATGPNGNFVRLVSFFATDRSGEIRPAIEKVAGSVAFK
ncbi:hypothetical protein [Tardiphaga sp.]|jgi:hypothetical protein|uniref:hypothetical protein n=1 Tax=Tardiphaga sp. TaxID=1926292 RepID=UPI0037DA0E71